MDKWISCSEKATRNSLFAKFVLTTIFFIMWLYGNVKV